ncbi:MAG: class I SAM-dependent methyltransferase [Anaerolineales bacterium]|nr:class I SAM-dependent methyltransferase [Anaerolineales bacterium]
MTQTSAGMPDYGNWVSTRLIIVPATFSLLFAGLSALLPLLVIVAALFWFVALYFAVARHLFSPRGKDVQGQVRGLLLSTLDWNGEGQALDIGCGNGFVTIAVAKQYPSAQVTGIDNWGERWQYGERKCETNAQLEGVADRVAFRRASAADLPFDDESFDLVVSNFVFHEVGGVKDKKELVREALRVVKKGGRFAIQDLFMWKQVYGDPDDLLEAVRSWGVREVTLIDTSKATFIPAVLRLPFMLGTAGILIGEK